MERDTERETIETEKKKGRYRVKNTLQAYDKCCHFSLTSTFSRSSDKTYLDETTELLFTKWEKRHRKQVFVSFHQQG